MNTQYFADCQTVNEVKKMYRELCFQFHPDLHVDEWKKYNEIMKAVNEQYQQALNNCNGQTFFGDDDKEHTYYYNQDIEEEVAVKIQELIALRMVGVQIWLIGTWVWVEGKTYQYKEQIKALGLNWHSKRKMWYFRQAQYKRQYSNKSFDELKDMYGAQKVKNEESQALGTH